MPGTQHMPGEPSLPWKRHFSRCLLRPVSVGLIINGTASQKVPPHLGYKFSSLETLQNVFYRMTSTQHLSDMA